MEQGRSERIDHSGGSKDQENEPAMGGRVEKQTQNKSKERTISKKNELIEKDPDDT